jgi:hypothetical protein
VHRVQKLRIGGIHMKRSRRVVLLMMGAAAIGSASAAPALAVGPCDPIDPRLLRPGEGERRRVDCARLGGFGSSGHRVHRYFHGTGG